MDRNESAGQSMQIPRDPGYMPRFKKLRESCAAGKPRIACEELSALHIDVDRFVEVLKRGLFAAPLAWNEEQRGALRWISLQHHLMARSARCVADALAQDSSATMEGLSHATALSLHHMAESMKCEMADAPREPRHYALLHGLMRLAIARGWRRDGLRIQVQGRELRCTAESLYFRALLLARSSGPLSTQQIEILDAWFCMWMPALRAVSEPPEGPWLCAGLDTSQGLRRSTPSHGGTGALPSDASHRKVLPDIVEHFQNGQIVPAEGHASRFRLEEHMLVLDIARRALRRIRDAVPRARRVPSGVRTELHVGLGEIISRPFVAAAPASLVASLVGVGTREAPDPPAGRADLMDSVYDVARRNILIVDISDSGLGLEGELADFKNISVGDIVALRLVEDGPLELCKVMRRAAAASGSRVLIGVHRASTLDQSRVLIGVRQLSEGVQRIEVTHPSAGRSRRGEQMLFVPGKDPSGRHDAFLITESALADRTPFEAQIGDQTFSLRINRVRDRGPGWVLAGFEISAMRKRAPLSVAA